MSGSIVQSAGFSWLVREGTDDAMGPEGEDYMDHLVREAKGGVFLDVGAHVGHFAIRASRVASRVVAFEPGSTQRAALLENVRLNALSNVEVRPLAVWHRSARLALHTPPGGHYGRSVVMEDEKGDIDATTLDEAAVSLPRVTLVKLDIQGSEANALEGATRLLSRHHPALLIELHDREYGDPTIRARVETTLRAHGYAWRIIHRGPTNDYLYALPPTRRRRRVALLLTHARVAAARAAEWLRLAPWRAKTWALRGTRRRNAA